MNNNRNVMPQPESVKLFLQEAKGKPHTVEELHMDVDRKFLFCNFFLQTGIKRFCSQINILNIKSLD